jgi:hypothetical protein
MRLLSPIGVLIALALAVSSDTFGQGEAAVPFLLIPPSIEANGMGGNGTALTSEDAIAPLHNPGHLGLFGLNGFMSGGFYTPATNWLPQFNITSLQYNVWALNGGIKLNTFVALPFDLSLGLGYSRINFDLGEYIVTGPGGPTEITRFESFEKSSNFSFGIGVEYLVRVGLGMTFKSIESNLSPIGTEQEQGTGKAEVTARDFGLVVEIPFVKAIETLSSSSLEIFPKAKPLFDLSLAYARSNIGDAVIYKDVAQADPLPRMASLGLCVEAGVVSTIVGGDWKILTAKISTEAQQLLVEWLPDVSWRYISGMGDISFSDNVIGGKGSSRVEIRKGWQLQVAEALYIRGGSYTSTNINYETSGLGIQLSGLLKILLLAEPSLREGSWIKFLADNFDIQYKTAKYGATSSALSGTTYKGFNIILRHNLFLK